MASDPTVQRSCSTHRLTARAAYGRHVTVWYASGTAEADRCRRILSSDMGMGARRVKVETI